MLTFPIGTMTGATINAFTGDAVVSIRANELCTSFEHDPGDTTFSGQAALRGFLHASLFTSGTFVSTFTEGDGSPLVFSVVSGSFDAAAGTGAGQLTASIPELGLAELNITAAHLLLDLNSFSLLGATAIVGSISGDMTLLPGASVVTADNRPFSLTLGADCF